ncbi:PREDICTED: progesterone receptor [Galeopterus variegatus]|uniref:Progesterone receptor n=1 Tax=Galeopterus variegatus TaxID=482537 RepID=A0ABM0RQG5_GALVR|nr:PREDICTED: progesterone receptor [Galeopterus variegatus]
MTELKAKDPRAPHVAGGAHSPTEVGSPLLGRLDPGPFQGSQTSDASLVVSAAPISPDGLLFPQPRHEQDPPDGKTQDQHSLSDVEGAYSRVEATGRAGGGSSRPSEKDSGLLDSVLDTLLEPSGPGQSHASPPACEATNSWCLFGPEPPADPVATPVTQGVLSPLMSRPGDKAGDSSETAGAHKVLPRGLSPSRQLMLPTPGSPHWPGAAVKPSPQPAVLKEGLAQVYPPYLNYLRPDSEASQSPQYSFESLPQKICLICGDEASGCHYGVLTCGSCKVFFKRAMEGQHNYLCAGRNDCIVDKIRRKNCPACRLRKCCQAGMVLGGRKFKKFNKVRVMRALDTVALSQPVGIPNESQRITFSPSKDLQLIPSVISLLMSIEPDVIYAGHDNTKPDTSSSLLTSLNQLGERQLLSVVKWSKSLPGNNSLYVIACNKKCAMFVVLLARLLAIYQYQKIGTLPHFLALKQRMKESSFYSLCLTMWQIPQEFVKLQVSHEEFLCMKVLLLLNTIPLEGLRSQNQFEEMRSSYIRELIKAIGLRQKGVVSSSQRFYQLTKLLDNLHDLVKQLHLYCLNTFIQSRALSVEFPEMMSEVIAAQLPKILAGMVKPLLFHKK